MSLYNNLFSVNQHTGYFLQILDIRMEEIGRFRDIWLNEDGTKIILLTRNGGGNRKKFVNFTEAMRQHHPCYLKDYDDEYDATYAYFEFRVPEFAEEECKKLATGIKPKTLREKFDGVQKEMENMTREQMLTDPRFTAIVSAFKVLEEPGSDSEPDNIRITKI